MKLSIAIAAADAPANAFVVFRGIEESIAKAAGLGFHGVELAIRSVSDINISRMEHCLVEHRMEVAALSTGLVYAADGISLLGTPEKAQAVFRNLIDLAADFGKQVNIGRFRGFKGDKTFSEAAETLKGLMSPIGEYAAAKRVRLLIEPVNRYEIDWINNLDEGAALLDILELDNVLLMPDVFHMNIEDVSIPEKIVEYGKYIGYVHLADSNRLAPGGGHLDFKTVFRALKEIQYEGWASVEILPKPEPDMAARRAADYLLPLVEEYNQTARKSPR
jgi:sugar phosphate isomerase/epimerase